uniref:Uncharacterized protein n=1 Tax=Serratia phage Kevin TaxID=3161161 RepID=A0AAU8KZ27_9CAUD
MYLIILNVVTIVLLIIAAASVFASVCNFIRAQFMMLSYYILSPNVDTNQRAAVQYEALAQFTQHAAIAFNRGAWSLIAIGVIILARYLTGVVLNAYL